MEYPAMPAEDRERWRALIRERCGHTVGESRFYYVERRLSERMRALGVPSYSGYYRLVASSPRGAGEWDLLAEELVNRETSFFRHAPSFDALTGRIVPSLLREKRLRGERTLSLWSAGCSGGQEAYSMAMAVLDVADPRSWEIRVLATDLSRKALEKGRSARYTERELETLPERHRRRYLVPAGRKGVASFAIESHVASLVRFEELDLHRLAGASVPRQDVIFCQNVLIYFEAADRLAIISELYARLNPGGTLVLAPGEVVGIRLPAAKPVLVDDVLVVQRAPALPAGEGAESERRNGTED